jgi:2-polyprenyl-3-methyl-5-hydroxy-6-metoxy-1,4-benzoquinol methylase
MFAKDMLKPGEKVLDIACGSGYGSKMFGLHGCKVTGMDVSEEAIKIAKKHNSHDNVTFQQGDIKNLGGLTPDFHAIVCFETLEHLPDGHDEILQGFKQLLRPGCPAICSIPLNHPDTHWHKKIFSFVEREDLFKSVFSKIEYSEANGSIIIGWNES